MSLSDKFEIATTDYQQAERLVRETQVLDFQAHFAVECTTAGRWAEALWYLDRLIAARTDDQICSRNSRGYGKLGRETDRQAQLALVFERGADQGVVIPRAGQLGRGGGWAEAALLLARCSRAGPLGRAPGPGRASPA